MAPPWLNYCRITGEKRHLQTPDLVTPPRWDKRLHGKVNSAVTASTSAGPATATPPALRCAALRCPTPPGALLPAALSGAPPRPALPHPPLTSALAAILEQKPPPPPARPPQQGGRWTLLPPPPWLQPSVVLHDSLRCAAAPVRLGQRRERLPSHFLLLLPPVPSCLRAPLPAAGLCPPAASSHDFPDPAQLRPGAASDWGLPQRHRRQGAGSGRRPGGWRPPGRVRRRRERRLQGNAAHPYGGGAAPGPQGPWGAARAAAVG